jgi:hypothetical protein
MIAAEDCSEKPIRIYQTTRRHMPENVTFKCALCLFPSHSEIKTCRTQRLETTLNIDCALITGHNFVAEREANSRKRSRRLAIKFRFFSAVYFMTLLIFRLYYSFDDKATASRVGKDLEGRGAVLIGGTSMSS